MFSSPAVDAATARVAAGCDAAVEAYVDRAVQAQRELNERDAHDEVMDRQQRNLVPVVVATVQHVLTAVAEQYSVVHVRSDDRDRALFAVCSLLDAMVDVLMVCSGDEGVDADVKDELITLLDTIMNDSDSDDLYATNMVRYVLLQDWCWMLLQAGRILTSVIRLSTPSRRCGTCELTKPVTKPHS